MKSPRIADLPYRGAILTPHRRASQATIARKHAVARLEVRSFNVAAQRFYRTRGWTEVLRYEGNECGVPTETLELRKALAPANR